MAATEALTPARVHRTVLSPVEGDEWPIVRNYRSVRDDGAVRSSLYLGVEATETLGLDRGDEGPVTLIVAPGDLLNDGVEIESVIFEALGAASSCWENLAGAGTFDSTRCKEIGDELVKALRVRGLT